MSASVAPDDRSLRLERTFRAPPGRVFAAWTEATHLARWFGPPGAQVARCSLDLRVGGTWAVTLAGNPRGLAVSGRYLEIDPPRRLSFTWAWHEDGTLETPREHETVVTIDFRPVDAGTSIALVQSRFRDAAGAANHRAGWTLALGQLGAALATAVAASGTSAGRRGDAA